MYFALILVNDDFNTKKAIRKNPYGSELKLNINTMVLTKLL